MHLGVCECIQGGFWELCFLFSFDFSFHSLGFLGSFQSRLFSIQFKGVLYLMPFLVKMNQISPFLLELFFDCVLCLLCVGDSFLLFERSVYLHVGLTLPDIPMEMHNCLGVENVSRESGYCGCSQWIQA
jgi:hypothetical protein